MNRSTTMMISIGRFVSFLTFALFCTMNAGAQNGPEGLQKQLVGSWKLMSFKSQREGEQTWREPLGASPKGYVVFTPEGRYVQLFTASGRKPPTNDAERAALLNSMLAFSGKYRVVKSDQLEIAVDTSWAEAHEGDRAKQVRFIKLEGSRLTMRTPLQLGTRTVTAGTGSARSHTELVLEREK